MVKGARFLLRGPRFPLRAHRFPLQAVRSPYGGLFYCLIVGRVPLRMPLGTNYRVTGNVYITVIIFFLELISA